MPKIHLITQVFILWWWWIRVLIVAIMQKLKMLEKIFLTHPCDHVDCDQWEFSLKSITVFFTSSITHCNPELKAISSATSIFFSLHQDIYNFSNFSEVCARLSISYSFNCEVNFNLTLFKVGGRSTPLYRKLFIRPPKLLQKTPNFVTFTKGV